MSAGDALSGSQFEAFKQSRWPGGKVGTTAKKARNHCASASHDFVQHLRHSDHPEYEHGYLVGVHMHVFEGHPSLHDTGHIAVVMNDESPHPQVVDWTAKQLDPSLGHPHVESFQSYRRRFTSDHSYFPDWGAEGHEWRDAEHPRT